MFARWRICINMQLVRETNVSISKMRRVQRELIRMIGAISDENAIRPDGLERRKVVDPNREVRCKAINNCILLLNRHIW